MNEKLLGMEEEMIEWLNEGIKICQVSIGIPQQAQQDISFVLHVIVIKLHCSTWRHQNSSIADFHVPIWRTNQLLFCRLRHMVLSWLNEELSSNVIFKKKSFFFDKKIQMYISTT